MRWQSCSLDRRFEASRELKSKDSWTGKSLLGRLKIFWGCLRLNSAKPFDNVLVCYWCASVTKAIIWGCCVKWRQVKTSLLGGFSQFWYFFVVCRTPNTFFHIIYSCCAHLGVGGGILKHLHVRHVWATFTHLLRLLWGPASRWFLFLINVDLLFFYQNVEWGVTSVSTWNGYSDNFPNME